jgi:hypothetical protein
MGMGGQEGRRLGSKTGHDLNDVRHDRLRRGVARRRVRKEPNAFK